MDESMEFNSTVVINQEVSQTTGKKLWDPKGFIVLSVLFSFLPAAILYSLNYGRLGLYKKRNISLFISFIAFAIMISMAFLINQSMLKVIFYGLNLGAAAYMNQGQTKVYKNHILNGGRKASYLVPAVISTVIAAIFLFLLFYSINIPDQKLMFKGSELYYTENVQKDAAEKLGTYLSEQGFFDESRKISVKIDKKSTTYEFSIIVDKSSIGNSDLEQSLKDMCEELSKEVFDNSKVDIVLCDNVFKPLKTISN